MNHYLLFRFVSPTLAEWCADGRCDQGAHQDLHALAPGRRSILIVPGEAVLLTHATLPQRNKATWLKALPYALEDGLAGEVEDLHFAVGLPRHGQATVAVLDRIVLENWLAQCAEAGVVPDAVIPDYLLVPYEANAWSLLLEENRAVVRIGQGGGFACERDNLTSLLDLALRETQDQAPDTWRVWGEPDPELHVVKPIDRQQEAVDPMQVFAAGLANGLELDLLQGAYSRQAQLGRWLRPWRLAAGLAVAWLGLQVVVQVTEQWRLTQERGRLKVEMAQVYRSAVPGAQRIVNPKAQLENRLRELQGGPARGETTFLELLQRGGRLLAEFPQVRVRGLRYNNQQLDFDLTGDSLETLEQLRQKLTEQADLETEMRTSKREDRIESLLSLRKRNT